MRRPLRKDEKALRAVHPSAGIAALYRQKLFALIDEMQRSYVYRLRAAFRRNTPRTTLAQDADPRAEVERIIKDLLAQAKDHGSARIFLPDGTEVYFDNRPVGRKRGQFSVRAPGDSKWTLMSGDALRTALEDVLTVPSPTATLEQTLAQLGAQWQRNLNEAAPKLASYFSKAVDQRTQTELKKILRDGRVSVRFQMTPAMKDVLQSTVVENVGLIKSIGSQYHTDIHGMVMRSVQTGRDLHGLSKDLRERYGITKRRANLIALNQNNMATSAMMRARQTEAGIDEALWLHSHGGKVPRPTHLANDGERYQISRGWHDPDPKVNKRIWPGQLINCFPGDMAVGLESVPSRLWRSAFNGPMVHIKVGSDLLKGTPNHPILTARGWLPLNEVQCGDQVVCVSSNRLDVVYNDENDRKPAFGELFEACSVRFGYVSRSGGCFDFHGDVPDGDVDEIIIVDDNLSANRQASVENIGDLVLAKAETVASLLGLGRGHHVAPSFVASRGNYGLLLLDRGVSKSDNVCLGSISSHAVLDQDGSNVGRGMARGSKSGGDRGGSKPAFVESDYLRGQLAPVVTIVDLDAKGPELFAEFVRIAADSQGRVFEFGSATYEFRRILDKSIMDFSGHVFTMETRDGYYSVGDAHIQAKNCRCVSKPIVKGFS